MGHIEKRKRDKGIAWRVRYRTPNGRELSKSFDRRVDAEKFLATVEADIVRGDWVDPTLGRITLDEWSQRWLASKRRIKPKTRAGYESLLSSRIVPTFGDVAINRIDRESVDAWVTDMLDEGLSASRVKQGYLVLNAMIKAAVRQGYLARNVIEGIEMPRVVSRERRFLTPAQVVELAESMPARYRAFVYVVAYGGLRFSEAVALRRRRCDLLHGRLEIAEGAVDVKGELICGTPKTHQIGSVSLPRFVVKALEEHLDRFVVPEPDALVFTGAEGGPLRNGNFHTRVWRPTLATTNLPHDLTPHELRHTCSLPVFCPGRRPQGHPEPDATFDDLGDLRCLRPPVPRPSEHGPRPPRRRPPASRGRLAPRRRIGLSPSQAGQGPVPATNSRLPDATPGVSVSARPEGSLSHPAATIRMSCWCTIGAEAETMTAILDRVRSLAAWMLGAPENSDPLTADEELDVISPDEGRAILDRVAQRHLGISGDEFRQRWTAGEFAGSRDPGVTRVAMLLPLGR